MTRILGRQVTDRMFAAGAQRLADYVSKEEIDAGNLYPQLTDLRDISLKVPSACVRGSRAGRACEAAPPDSHGALWHFQLPQEVKHGDVACPSSAAFAQS